MRSTFFPKRNITKNFNVSTEVPKAIEKSDKIYRSKQTLPRTSYYSRLRNNGASSTFSTSPSVQEVTESMAEADKKTENIGDSPLIFTNNHTNMSEFDKEGSGNHKFIITVNSKESVENGTDNEIISKMEESQSKSVINVITTTQRYHATYKDKNNDADSEEKEKTTVTTVPPIRNIQTRKYSRKLLKRRDPTTPRSKERNLKKYSDTFSKTTEASSNGVSIIKNP